MDGIMTLRELCNELNVSRRTVQGYEKAGLVVASGKNKYGHLLYNEQAQNRIAKIRLYQKFGFTIRQISELIDAPDYVVLQALERQMALLKEERGRINGLIKKMHQLIGGMSTAGYDVEQSELQIR